MDERRSKRISRRALLKKGALGAAIAFAPRVFVPNRGMVYAAGAPTHPEINPLRVAGVQDPEMTTAINPTATWEQQEHLVRADVVRANLDRLACVLAEEKTAGHAWKRIFLKPPKKAWSDVVVAIKSNEIASGKQQTRSAIHSSLCRVLVDVLGVKPANIFIYDACHGGNMPAYKDLPEGVRMAKQWGKSVTPVPIPAPYKGGTSTARCLKELADGTVDILINVALCKGHGNGFGGFTMLMKNHLGTFEPRPVHEKGTDPADYLVGINKTPQVLGTIDKKSGKVLFPRQQLCIIDAIWASKGGPVINPSVQPNRIFMGTCGPVVDYQVATKFRRDAMKWRINEAVTLRFLNDFGFKPADLPNGGQIIEPAA